MCWKVGHRGNCVRGVVLSLVLSFLLFFLFLHRATRESLYIWVADERKRRIRDFRNGGDGHPSFVLLPLSAKRKKEREDDSRVTHLRQIFIPKRRREIFSRSIDGSTCCLSISRSRTGLGLV